MKPSVQLHLFLAVYSASDKTDSKKKHEVTKEHRLHAMDLEAQGLLTTSGKGGKTFARCTVLGFRLGDTFFTAEE